MKSRKAVALVCVTAFLSSGVPAATADESKGRRIPGSFFGMHDGGLTTWPASGAGSVRLWDAGVTWREVETRPGVFQLDRLDALVAIARRQGTRVTLVLGQTPPFHVAPTARPAGPVELLGAGATRMPVLTAWRRYLRVVADRYAGRVEAVQVWNEANILGFWSGTQQQMAVLTAVARDVVDRANRRHGSSMKLVAPSYVARTNTLPMDRFLRAEVDGRPTPDLVDAVALSLYPPPDGGPEDSHRRLRQLTSTILGRRGVAKPVWNTEINYGLASGGAADPVPVLSAETQAAYVVRTYLLNAADEVRRVFWYGWAQQGNVAVRLSGDGRPTLAGRAVTRARRWMTGAQLVGCRRVAEGRLRGLRVCRLEERRASRLIYWHPHRVVTVHAPRGAVWVRDIHGVRRAVRSRVPLTVDGIPLLVRVVRKARF